MHPNLLPWANLAAALPLAWVAWEASQFSTRQAKETTLVGPLRWLVVALLFWVAAQIAAIPAFGADPGAISRVALFALTLLLAPFISVLGAKRPGARVWDLFIVLPMLVVVNWPAWAAIMTGTWAEPVDLEGPALAGLAVVIVMIVSNYFGTAFTGTVVLFSTGILAGLTRFSRLLPTLGDGTVLPSLVTSICVSIALLSAIRGARRRSQTRNGLDGALLEFRDWFGVLWARRVMDRLNQTAEKDGLSVHVSLDGLHWADEATPQQRADSAQELERAFRWLLRRFADNEWLDKRIRAE